MGIYIESIKLPEDKIVMIVSSDGKCYGSMADYAYKRNPIGAVTEVPDHGDLIDRSALPWENQGLMLTDPDEWGLKAVDIEAAPTVIPAEPGETMQVDPGVEIVIEEAGE